MKKIYVIVLVLALGMNGIAMAQVKKKTPGTAATQQPLLKTSIDSLSYAIGISAASFYKEQGIKEVNTALVTKAINDALKSRTRLLNDQQCNGVIISYIQKARAENAAVAKKEGEAFLADNKTKPGVVTLPDGLQYSVIKQGDGPKPVLTDKVKCHYTGRLTDGSVFESSLDRGEPIVFNLNGVIAGWTEALQLMPVGSKWRLFIPSNLAYGDQSQGDKIKAGSTLIFDVELLEIVK